MLMKRSQLSIWTMSDCPRVIACCFRTAAWRSSSVMACAFPLLEELAFAARGVGRHGTAPGGTHREAGQDHHGGMELVPRDERHAVTADEARLAIHAACGHTRHPVVTEEELVEVGEPEERRRWLRIGTRVEAMAVQILADGRRDEDRHAVHAPRL